MFYQIDELSKSSSIIFDEVIRVFTVLFSQHANV